MKTKTLLWMIAGINVRCILADTIKFNYQLPEDSTLDRELTIVGLPNAYSGHMGDKCYRIRKDDPQNWEYQSQENQAADPVFQEQLGSVIASFEYTVELHKTESGGDEPFTSPFAVFFWLDYGCGFNPVESNIAKSDNPPDYAFFLRQSLNEQTLKKEYNLQTILGIKAKDFISLGSVSYARPFGSFRVLPWPPANQDAKVTIDIKNSNPNIRWAEWSTSLDFFIFTPDDNVTPVAEELDLKNDQTAIHVEELRQEYERQRQEYLTALTENLTDLPSVNSFLSAESDESNGADADAGEDPAMIQIQNQGDGLKH